MITLRYGRQKPQNGNKGLPVFDALAANIELDDAHDHDGVNSPPIASYKLSRGTRDIAASGFVLDVPTGWYSQNVAMPAGYTLDDSDPFFIVVGGVFGGMSFKPTWRRNGGNLSLTVWLPSPLDLSMVCI